MANSWLCRCPLRLSQEEQVIWETKISLYSEVFGDCDCATSPCRSVCICFYESHSYSGLAHILGCTGLFFAFWDCCKPIVPSGYAVYNSCGIGLLIKRGSLTGCYPVKTRNEIWIHCTACMNFKEQCAKRKIPETKCLISYDSVHRKYHITP